MMDEQPSCGASVTVAVSTLGHRVSSLSLPAPVAGINYLVLVQNPVSEALMPSMRDDVRVEAIETMGLSNSRNAALALAEGPFVLFSDDDLDLDPKGILALRTALEQAPDLTWAAGWRQERLPRRGVRSRIHRLGWFNSGRICAPELMVRNHDVTRAGVWFDPNFGVGARYPLGEEYAFVTDMLKAGLKGRSFPTVTGSHPHASTGENWSDPDLLAARQMLLTRVFGLWAPLLRMVYALRHRHRLGSVGAAVRFAMGQPQNHFR